MPRKRTIVLTTIVSFSALAPAAAPQPRVTHARPEMGRIAGTVEVSSALAPRRPRFRIYAEAGPGSVPPAHGGDRDELTAELRNVVVYLESDSANGLAADSVRAAPLRRGVMAQSSERFDPHVLAVVQGARVDFPNRDDIYHNVFSLSSARSFDLGRYRKGSSKSVVFPKPGVSQVFCHIHSDMSGIILVLGNPFFAVPETSGRYAVEDVPPGEYTVVGWHERARPVTRRVRVVAGQTTTINFVLPLEARPTP